MSLMPPVLSHPPSSKKVKVGEMCAIKPRKVMIAKQQSVESCMRQIAESSRENHDKWKQAFKYVHTLLWGLWSGTRLKNVPLGGQNLVRV